MLVCLWQHLQGNAANFFAERPIAFGLFPCLLLTAYRSVGIMMMLYPEEIAIRMDIPLDSVLSSRNGSA